MSFNEKIVLGKTGLKVGRLGIASSYRAPEKSYEEAFEKGCNYFTLGTFIKGRSKEMIEAIKKIVAKGERDKLVLSQFTYAHNNYLTKTHLIKGLKGIGIEYVDVLLLGYFPKRPPQKLIDGALELKQQGLIRYIGISSHNRKLFKELAKENVFDVFHIRYNAVNSGAENDTFPYLREEPRPGVVSFTATRWGQLLNSKKMPEGEDPLTAVDCYRFVLSNPAVDVCMTGAKTEEQMTENLSVLEADPLSESEMTRIKKIGDFIYNK